MCLRVFVNDLFVQHTEQKLAVEREADVDPSDSAAPADADADADASTAEREETAATGSEAEDGVESMGTSSGKTF